MRYRRLDKLFLLLMFAGGFLSAGPSRAAEPTNYATTTLSNTEQALEQELFSLTNQQRALQGLPALIQDDLLVRIAREHSRGMAYQGFISHDQPSGDLKARMNRVGYLYEVARENVASARTVLKAHCALISSAPHKSNILAGDVTRVGIGIAWLEPPLDKQLYVTEVFAEPRGEYEPSAVQTQLVSRVDDLRQRGAGSLQPDPVLGEMASRSVQSLSLPYNRKELQSLLAEAATELKASGKTDVTRLEVDVQLLRNPKNLKVPVPERDGQAHKYGSAVRQVKDEQNQTAFLVLTLIGIAR